MGSTGLHDRWESATGPIFERPATPVFLIRAILTFLKDAWLCRLHGAGLWTHDSQIFLDMDYGWKAASVAVLLGLIDPFGLGTATDEASTLALKRIFATTVTTDARDEVAVVLATEKWLREVDFSGTTSWPPRLEHYSFLLSQLEDFAPRAIFFDILFVNKYVGEDQNFLTQTFLSDLRSGGDRGGEYPRIFTATLPPDGEVWRRPNGYPDRVMPQPPGPELPRWDPLIRSDVSDAAAPAYVGYEGFGDAYPLYFFNDHRFPSPAMALYQRYCNSLASNGSARQERLRCDDSLYKRHEQGWSAPEAARNPLVAIHGVMPSRHYSAVRIQASPYQYCPSGWSGTEFLRQALSTTSAGLAWLFGRRGDATCSFVPIINADVLDDVYSDKNSLVSRERCQSAPTAELSANDHIACMLADRVILVGAAATGSGDDYVTPFGKFPGILRHAVALENLLHYGDDYRRIIEDFHFLSLFSVFQFLFAFTTNVTTRNMSRRYFEECGIRVFCWRILLYYVFLVLASIAIALFLFVFASIDIINWIGVVSLAATATLFSRFNRDRRNTTYEVQS